MIDFAIDDQGDLIFDDYEEPKGFKLSFRLSETNGFNLSFHVSQEPTRRIKSDFSLHFDVKEKTGETHSAKLVSELEQKLQSMRIALMTERGELAKRPVVGSTLILSRHENIHDANNLRAIEHSALEAISGILTTPSVIAKAEKGTGNFYCQNVSIYIYEKDILIFKFQI